MHKQADLKQVQNEEDKNTENQNKKKKRNDFVCLFSPEEIACSQKWIRYDYTDVQTVKCHHHFVELNSRRFDKFTSTT